LRIYPKFWTKPVQTSRQYVELDWLGVNTSNSTFVSGAYVIAAAVRIKSNSDFVGLMFERNNSTLKTKMFLYSPGRFKNEIIAGENYAGRIRLEVQDGKFQVFIGNAGVRDAKEILYEYSVSEDLYDGFLTSFLTGWGFGRLSTNTDGSYSAYGVADNYESGDNVGPPRFFVNGSDAVSETRSDTVPRVDIVWSEYFDADPGTPLVDLGFDFMTTEFQGDPTRAVISANHRLTLTSGTKSSAIWTKPTLNLNHWVECTLYAYPVVNLEMPIIIRAADSEHFIGIWFEANDLVMGYRYATTTVEFIRVSKSLLGFPQRIRLEARGNYVYGFRSIPGFALVANQPIGASTGYRIPDSTPMLKTSIRSGVGRINDFAAVDFADDYQAGLTLIPSKVLSGISSRSETFVDDADSIVIDDTARPNIKKARSETSQDSDIQIGFEQFCTPSKARSETPADVPAIQPEAVSYTFADQAVVTVDVIIVSPAVSETSADEWHEPSNVGTLPGALSETYADDVTTVVLSTVIAKDANSPTRARKAPITGFGIVDSERAAHSETRADTVRVTPQRFVKVVLKGRSETYADATLAAVTTAINVDEAYSPTRADGAGAELHDTYRPWLFS
jgi:hypothetical protein